VHEKANVHTFSLFIIIQEAREIILIRLLRPFLLR
jgi:hypothetical protein